MASGRWTTGLQMDRQFFCTTICAEIYRVLITVSVFENCVLIGSYNNNNINIYLKSDIHKMFNRLYIKTYTNNITEIHV